MDKNNNYWNCMGLENPNGQNGNPTQQSANPTAQGGGTTPPTRYVPASPANGNDSDRRYEAFNRAHDIRKFEIELFWKRGTYYWAFILAAFTAHFAAVNFLLKDECVKISFCTLRSLPTMSLVVLCVTSFFCFFFSFAWVLMNKGSKFWQLNWEEHINELETEFSGNLYETYLNKANNEKFGKCPFNLKPYGYSVTKITMMTSIVLAIASVLLFIFNIFLLIASNVEWFGKLSYINSANIIWAIILLVLATIVTCIMFSKTVGNKDNASPNKWVCSK